jgi:nucleoid-associated protein YgaU
MKSNLSPGSCVSRISVSATKSVVRSASSTRRPPLAASARAQGGNIYEVSMSAQSRWLSRAADPKDKTLYRPGTLNRVKAQLASLNPAIFGLGQVAEGNSQFTMHQVKRGDQLRALARDLVGDPEKADLIFQANLDKLDSPDRISGTRFA